MINDYVRSARQEGAGVYFSFCPINALSLGDVDKAEQEAFVQALREGLDCPLLSPLSDSIMDAGFFYDSNYHLNDSGVRYHSLMLIADIQRILGFMRQTTAELPHPPVVQRDNTVLASGVWDGIAYDVTARGATVTGLDEQAKGLQILNIPEKLGDAEVISVVSEAFFGSAAKEVILPTTIAQLPRRLFAGMDRLEKVKLLAYALPEVGDELLLDAAPGLKICVPPELYGTYFTDYFWSAYTNQLEMLE